MSENWKHCSIYNHDAEERRGPVTEAQRRWVQQPRPLDEVCYKRPRWTGSDCGKGTA